MTTPALRLDPYVTTPPACVSDLIDWECAGWHSPEWWVRHWTLTPAGDRLRARMQENGKDDWLRWAKALGEGDGTVVRMLEADRDDQIGFAIVSAVKK